MKALFKSTTTLLITAAICLTASAQEPQGKSADELKRNHIDEEVQFLPDSLKILRWRADHLSTLPTQRYQPTVPMSSVVTVNAPKLPKNYLILDNQTLRVWRMQISNGSAFNWGNTPASYLDARTLSFPAPR